MIKTKAAIPPQQSEEVSFDSTLAQALENNKLVVCYHVHGDSTNIQEGEVAPGEIYLIEQMQLLKAQGVKSLGLEMFPAELEMARKLQQDPSFLSGDNPNSVQRRLGNIRILLNKADEANIKVVPIDLKSNIPHITDRYHARHRYIKNQLRRLMTKGKTVALLGIMHAHLSEELQIPGVCIQSKSDAIVCNVHDFLQFLHIFEFYKKMGISCELTLARYQLVMPGKSKHIEPKGALPFTPKSSLLSAPARGGAQLIKSAEKILDNNPGKDMFIASLKKCKYGQALRRACTSSKEDIALSLVKLLIEFRGDNLPADVNEKAGLKQYTALHYAAIKNHASVYDLLKQNGADSNIAGKDGKTPAAIAQDEKVQQRMIMPIVCITAVFGLGWIVLKKIQQQLSKQSPMSFNTMEGLECIAAAIVVARLISVAIEAMQQQSLKQSAEKVGTPDANIGLFAQNSGANPVKDISQLAQMQR